MATISKYQVAWTGGVGGPGVTTFYFSSTIAIPGAAVRTLFGSFASSVAAGITWTFPSTGLNIDEATGQPVGAWSATAPAVLTSGGAGAYSPAVGAVVNWKTGTFAGGRELRGKTFVVPLAAAAFTTSGVLSAGAVSAFQSGANAFIGNPSPPLVWSRKNGTSSPVTSATIPSMTAVLRSRRD